MYLGCLGCFLLMRHLRLLLPHLARSKEPQSCFPLHTGSCCTQRVLPAPYAAWPLLAVLPLPWNLLTAVRAPGRCRARCCVPAGWEQQRRAAGPEHRWKVLLTPCVRPGTSVFNKQNQKNPTPETKDPQHFLLSSSLK